MQLCRGLILEFSFSVYFVKSIITEPDSYRVIVLSSYLKVLSNIARRVLERVSARQGHWGVKKLPRG